MVSSRVVFVRESVMVPTMLLKEPAWVARKLAVSFDFKRKFLSASQWEIFSWLSGVNAEMGRREMDFSVWIFVEPVWVEWEMIFPVIDTPLVSVSVSTGDGAEKQRAGNRRKVRIFFFMRAQFLFCYER